MGHALWSGRSTQSLKTTDMADAAEDAKRKEELNNSLKEYISEWRKTREAEEDELAKLKEKQAKRKEIRAEQEKKLNAAKKEEEEKMKKEEADRKAKEAEEKKKRLEEAEAKRQEMLDAQKAQKADANEKKKSVAGGPGNDARMYSKYERRTDTRSYDDRKKMYEGGWEVVRAEHLEASWKEKHDEWSKRPSKKLPKWFGERPGKKAGAPETPEGEEEAEAAAAEEEDYDEEEEEEEEYDEEEE